MIKGGPIQGGPPEMEPSVYRRVRANLTGEWEDRRNEVEQTRLRIQQLGNQKRWIDWIS